MAFHEVTFPDGYSIGARLGPGFDVQFIGLNSGQEQRIARLQTPVHQFNLGYGLERYDQLTVVRDFFIQRLGGTFGFRLRDWSDYNTTSTGTALGQAAPVPVIANDDQNIGTGDSVDAGATGTAKFQLRKQYGIGGLYVRNRLIEKPRQGTVLIAVDGVAQTEGVDYTIDYTTGIVTFTAGSIPLLGEAVTWGGEFDVPVRFDPETSEWLAITADSFSGGTIPTILCREILSPTPIPGEHFHGGAIIHPSGSADITMSLTQGTMHTFQPTAAHNVELPDAATLSTGDTLFVLRNNGTFALDFRTPAPASVLSLPGLTTAELHLGLDTNGNKVWVPFT